MVLWAPFTLENWSLSKEFMKKRSSWTWSEGQFQSLRLGTGLTGSRKGAKASEAMWVSSGVDGDLICSWHESVPFTATWDVFRCPFGISYIIRELDNCLILRWNMTKKRKEKHRSKIKTMCRANPPATSQAFHSSRVALRDSWIVVTWLRKRKKKCLQLYGLGIKKSH